MSREAPKTAMLFAAGRGTRLKPLTDSCPKPLLDVGGKPLIAWALERLARAGVATVVVNLHHLGEQIEAALGDGAQFGLRLVYSPETELLGTGGGLLHAQNHFKGEARFWALNSDTLLDLDLRAVWEDFVEKKPDAHAALLVTHTQSPPQFGGIWLDASRRRVCGFFNPPEKAAVEADFCGVSILSPAIFSYLAQSGKAAPCLIRHGLLPLFQAGHALLSYPTSADFNDVGSPERLEAARARSWQNRKQDL